MCESFRLSPGTGFSYSNLISSYLNLNRMQEARALLQEALAKNINSPDLHVGLYMLAFLQSDAPEMEKQVRWGGGKPGVEDVLLSLEADTAAHSGQLGKAREFSRRPVDSAQKEGEREEAATYSALAGLRESYFGNADEARRRATL